MPMYPVINRKTGEEKDVVMSVGEYEKWRAENPDWDRDWVKGVAGVRNMNRDASDYSSDAICDDFRYEDKNDSLSSSRFRTKDGQIHGRNSHHIPKGPGWVTPDRTAKRQQGDSASPNAFK